MPVSSGEPPAPSSDGAAPGRLRRWLVRGSLGAVGLLVVVNLAILGAHTLAAAQSRVEAPARIEGIPNLRVVDERVWRGRAPTTAAYEALAAAGVTAVVDLRAEDDIEAPVDRLAELGVDYHSLPIRDGQTPSSEEVRRFIEVVDQQGPDGLVYVHCGAGVGRAGSMSAAYLVATGQETNRGALARNLEVGPPSIEQIWFASQIDDPDDTGVPWLVRAVSRFFDGPRRLWHNLGL